MAVLNWFGKCWWMLSNDMVLNRKRLKSYKQKLRYSLKHKTEEDGKGDVVVRIIELYGSHSKTQIKAGFDFNQAVLCDLLERPKEQLEVSDGRLRLELKPYQLLTIRFIR